MYEWIYVIQKLINFIDDNAVNNPSLEKISRQVGYSPYYCSAQFHLIAGMTIKSYMAKRRLYMAAVAVRDTDKRLIDIALEYGYFGQNSLTRAFRNAYGCTPAAYRKNPASFPVSMNEIHISHENYSKRGTNMLSKLIKDNYGIEVTSIKFFNEQEFGDKIFLAETGSSKYIVKAYPLWEQCMENEGDITEFVRNNGISAPKFLKTKNGKYLVKVETEEMHFHVQEFVEGEILQLNTAPEWFLDKSAQILGRIHAALKNYGGLPTHFDGGFFSKATTDERKHHFAKLSEEATAQGNTQLIALLKERLKHLERISAFDIDVGKLTYSNTHGWFQIGELIVNNQDITVIDWTFACRKPICYEVIMSYIFAAPECKDGRIDIDGLKRYINNHSKYFPLNDYDIQIMPYLYYYTQMLCNYSPQEIYDNKIPDWWKSKCALIINVTNRLYENAENLANELRTG